MKYAVSVVMMKETGTAWEIVNSLTLCQARDKGQAKAMCRATDLIKNPTMKHLSTEAIEVP